MNGVAVGKVRWPFRLLPPSGPGRPLAAAALAGSAGYGLFLPCVVLFSVRVVGLPAHAIGVGTTFAGLFALAWPVLVGHIADLHDERRVAVVCGCATAAGVAGFGFVGAVPVFVAVQILVMSSFAGLGVAQNVMIARMLGQGDRVHFKAYQRVMRNVGLSMGALVATLPIQLNTRRAYQTALIAAGLFLAVSGLLTLLTPRPSRSAPPRTGKNPALVDVPYLLTSLLCGALAARSALLTMGLPLWITAHVEVPRSLLSPLIILNTILVTVWQVRAARGAQDVRGAQRVNRRGSAALAVSCLFFATASVPHSLAAAVLLACGVLVFTFGEMWTSAAAWTFSYDLAGSNAGQYQGVFALGTGAGAAAGPALVTTAVELSRPGWLLGALWFLMAGALTSSVVRRADAKTPQGGDRT